MHIALLSHNATTTTSKFDTGITPTGSSSTLNPSHGGVDHSHLLAIIIILLVTFGA